MDERARAVPRTSDQVELTLFAYAPCQASSDARVALSAVMRDRGGTVSGRPRTVALTTGSRDGGLYTRGAQEIETT